MNWIQSILLGVSLAMDALAVSLALGAAGRRSFHWQKILLTAALFGFFQALMPLIGWFGASLCGSLIQTAGRILASVLLFVIGIKMIRERESGEPPVFAFRPLILLAFATSIDALVVGVGFACLARTSIWADISIIGGVTALISAAGCLCGRLFGDLCGSRCALAGGFVLIAIAVKILCFG